MDDHDSWEECSPIHSPVTNECVTFSLLERVVSPEIIQEVQMS